MPYSAISGKSFRNYTERLSGYASRGDVVSQDKTLAAVSSPGSAKPGAGSPAPRQRADARRNVDALIEAAKTVFATSGVDAPAKEITDMAGVGAATRPRPSPQRSALSKPVVEGETAAVAAAAPAVRPGPEPAEALIK